MVNTLFIQKFFHIYTHTHTVVAYIGYFQMIYLTLKNNEQVSVCTSFKIFSPTNPTNVYHQPRCSYIDRFNVDGINNIDRITNTDRISNVSCGKKSKASKNLYRGKIRIFQSPDGERRTHRTHYCSVTVRSNLPENRGGSKIAIIREFSGGVYFSLVYFFLFP